MISLSNQLSFTSHRSGWNYAIHALKPLHDPQGVLFDGYLENSFVWKTQQSNQVPYTQPWVGFLHNPPDMPRWFGYEQVPQVMFTQDDWQKSLAYCVGLFCLSNYHADWLRGQVEQPVSALIHPTEISNVQFSFDRFVANPYKKIVQVGWWLRKLNAIYQLPIAADNPLGYRKIKLSPKAKKGARNYIQSLEEKEKAVEGLSFEPEWTENTYPLGHVSNDEYDRLLSENIVFVAVHASSANNAVIECIARATPILINPLPAVVEYLGPDYPMYFHTLAEAAEKAMDLALIQDTHEYLKACDTRQRLSGEYFCQQFAASEVYQQI